MGKMEQAPRFLKAQPVWVEGREREMNLTLRLKGRFSADEGDQFMFSAAGATIYRAFVNGRMIAHGPARCAHGFFRVDEWPVPPILLRKENTLLIEVAGYNVNCFSYVDQPSFIQAELRCKDKAVLHTGEDCEFFASIDNTRDQRAARYSFQRSFVESYHITGIPEKDTTPCRLSCQESKCLLPRRVPLPVFQHRMPKDVIQDGTVEFLPAPPEPFKDRALYHITERLKGFDVGEMLVYFSYELERMKMDMHAAPSAVPWRQRRFTAGDSAMLSFGGDFTGFITMDATVHEDTILWVLFDEMLEDGRINPFRSALGAVRWELAAGEHILMTIEPYVVNYLQVVCQSGNLTISNPMLVEFKGNLPLAPKPSFNDELLDRVYDAATETLLQNSLDLFTDCPGRERAGWLCDSFFTARAEKLITGQNIIEYNFLENFLLPDSFDFLPDGMLPMCYPSDHNDMKFIPNWAMWLVLELEDYLARGGTRDLIDAFKPKVYKLIRYFDPFVNEDGLLENLEGWIFIDWSRANDCDLVSGVNYPSNMLFTRMLEAVSAMYGDREAGARAVSMHETIRKQSWNGTHFIDNRIRKDGALIPGPASTHACQDYAFFCGTATPERYPALWIDFCKQFDRTKGLCHTYNLAQHNAFIAFYVGLAALERYGCAKEADEIARNVFFPEAEDVGTLWEHFTKQASLNHGFASYAANMCRLAVEG